MAFIAKSSKLAAMPRYRFFLGQVKIEGKIFRESLKTDVFLDPKLLLADFVKKNNRPTTGTFAEARVPYETAINNDHTIRRPARFTGGSASKP